MVQVITPMACATETCFLQLDPLPKGFHTEKASQDRSKHWKRKGTCWEHFTFKIQPLAWSANSQLMIQKYIHSNFKQSIVFITTLFKSPMYHKLIVVRSYLKRKLHVSNAQCHSVNITIPKEKNRRMEQQRKIRPKQEKKKPTKRLGL